jgi:hypothetical protein
MSTLDTNTTHAVRRFAAVAIVVALAVSLAAIATIGAETGATGDSIFAWLGDYFSQAGAALGNE